MRSTRGVVDLFRAANAGSIVNEDRVRHAIRRGLVAPQTFAGRLVWSDSDIKALATALNLKLPQVIGATVNVAEPAATASLIESARESD
jgi:hypothetical protein